MKTFQKIIVATDLTPASEPALKEAVEMAKEKGSELVITHVYQPPDVAQAEAITSGVYDEWDRNLRTAAEKGLKPLVEDAKKEGINARALVLSGPAYEAIADAAEKNDADLVVMGTHGRKGVSRFFVGSVASRVISTAPCPVMTVRAV